MLHIVTVRSGTRYGPEYVDILFDSICRNLHGEREATLEVFTDQPDDYADETIIKREIKHGLRGWWPILGLFERGLWQDGDRVIFCGLDSAVTGPLDDMVAWDGEGLGAFKDPWNQEIGSHWMSWRAGDMAYLFDEWQRRGFPKPAGGDQVVTSELCTNWHSLDEEFPGAVRSYKHSGGLLIPGTKIYAFHGIPKPDQITDGWVPAVWKIGGGTSMELITQGNTSWLRLAENIKFAGALKHRWITHPRTGFDEIVIVGGGPSARILRGVIDNFRCRGTPIMALNGALKWLESEGIPSNYHVMMDARPENFDFISADSRAQKLYASQCHPSVTRAADVLWHAGMVDVERILPAGTPDLIVGGGSTVGLKAICLAHLLGYKRVVLFGYDSCYHAGKHHAYDQSLNDGERVLDITIPGIPGEWKCSPWQVQQAQEFIFLMPHAMAAGLEVDVYGEGLIPAIATRMAIPDATETGRVH